MPYTVPSRTDHRPWPVPARRWAWRQSWYDLLFAHWPVPAAMLRPLIPDGLKLQEFDGTAWLGVVPFRMENVMRRGFPNLPGLSAFPEINVRTYVERDGKPGVWFISLDAPNRLANWGARRWFHLPYRRSRIEITQHDGGYQFCSDRRGEVFRASYKPVSEVFYAKSGTLETFLAERYCLYARSRHGEYYRGEVLHDPWPLQLADGEIDAAALLDGHGLNVGNAKPLLHFSKGVDVAVWSLEQLT